MLWHAGILQKFRDVTGMVAAWPSPVAAVPCTVNYLTTSHDPATDTEMTFDFAQVVNMLSAAATSVAALLIYIQIRSDRAWSRLETSHNILNDFVSGVEKYATRWQKLDRLRA